MAPQHHTSTFACRAVGENKPQKMNDFRRESFLLTHASTSRLSGFRVAKATRNLPAIRWLYVIYQYVRWVKKSTSFQFRAANLQKLFQTTIIPPPHFQFFSPASPASPSSARPYKRAHRFSAASPPITCPNCNCQRTRYYPASYRRSFFSAKPTFCSFPSHPTPSL